MKAYLSTYRPHCYRLGGHLLLVASSAAAAPGVPGVALPCYGISTRLCLTLLWLAMPYLTTALP